MPVECLRRWSGLLLVAPACVGLWWMLPARDEIGDLLGALALHWWLAAGVALLSGHALRALRLRSEWACEHAPRLGECLRVTLLHGAAVNLMPMRVGEAGYPLLLNRRWGVSLADATLSLLWLRVQDAVVLGAASLILLAGEPWWVRVTLALALVAMAVLLLPLIARWIAQHRTGTVASRVAMAVLRGGRIGWLYGAANWALKLGVLGGLLVALGGLECHVGIAGALGGEVAAVLPVQPPGGLGTYEAGVWLGASGVARLSGLPVDDRLLVGAALLVHGFVIAVAVLGASAAMLLPEPRLRHAQRPR
jgi:hypothetical protein